MIYFHRKEQGEHSYVNNDYLIACVLWFLNWVKLLLFHLYTHDILTDLITASQLLMLIYVKTRAGSKSTTGH